MASSSSSFALFLAHIIFIIALLLVAGRSSAAAGCYSSIISFGASLSDTGNYFHLYRGGNCPVCNPPYGETYFHRPTGRYSDGRNFLDFIAETFGLPLVPPYLGGSKGNNYFQKGVNFAVGGATALDLSFYDKMGFPTAFSTPNISLSFQMGWFKQLLPSLCASKSDCANVLGKALIVMGEFGGNDYNNPLFAHRSLDEIHKIYVPKVIDAISAAITDLIKLGGKAFLVPGVYPLGCTPLYRSVLKSTSDNYYSRTGCINWVNKFSEYHNNKLLEELEQIRQRHPDCSIIYADCYGSTMNILHSPHRHGFKAPRLLNCCGGGGTHNYTKFAQCGSEEAKACSVPSSYIYWDNIHFTEAANKIIVAGLMDGSFTTPPINQVTCPSVIA